jgi:hypothetical protein
VLLAAMPTSQVPSRVISPDPVPVMAFAVMFLPMQYCFLFALLFIVPKHTFFFRHPIYSFRHFFKVFATPPYIFATPPYVFATPPYIFVGSLL